MTAPLATDPAAAYRQAIEDAARAIEDPATASESKCDWVRVTLDTGATICVRRGDCICDPAEFFAKKVAAAIRTLPTPPAPAVPEGWQLVPVVPTPAMIAALECRIQLIDDYGGQVVWSESLIEDAYPAMLAAAPKPTGGN